MGHTFRYYLGQPVRVSGRETTVVLRAASYRADGCLDIRYRVAGQPHSFSEGCLQPVPAPAPGFDELVCETNSVYDAWTLAGADDHLFHESLCSADYDHWAQVLDGSSHGYQLVSNDRRRVFEDLDQALLALVGDYDHLREPVA